MWLLEKRPAVRKTCDYCNGPFGLARQKVPPYSFCKLKCQELFLDAVYRPPDQYELPLLKPPDPNAYDVIA